MGKHTPEPWEAQWQPRLSVIHGPEGEHIADTGCWRDDEHPEMRANAERIVACVNACAGISTEQLSPRLLTRVFTVLEEAAESLDDDAHLSAMGHLEAALELFQKESD